MAIYMTDVFTGTPFTSWNSSNWTDDYESVNASAYIDINGNAGQIHLGTATVYLGESSHRATGAGQHADMQIDFSFTFFGSQDGTVEVWLRAVGPFNSQTGYELWIARSGSGWTLKRVVDWSSTDLNSMTSMTFTDGSKYKGRFKVSGTGATVTLSAKVWLATDSEPGSWTTYADTNAARITTSNWGVINGKGGNASGLVINIDDVTISDGAGSVSGTVVHTTTRNATVVGVAAVPSKQGQVAHTTTRNATVVGLKAGTHGVHSFPQISMTAIVAGFGGSPAPTLQLTELNTPSPGVRVTVLSVAPDADSITIYRTDSSGETVSLRGATEAVLTGSFVIDDYEAPLNTVLTYTATTRTITKVPSTGSQSYAIELSSVYTWLTDPVVPTNAVAVRVREFPSISKSIDNAMLSVIGSPYPVMVAGQRLAGSGRLSLLTLDLGELELLRSVLQSTAILLLRAPYTTWDLGTAFLGIGNVSESRWSRLISDPTRIIELDVTYVAQPPATITGALHTYAELAQRGYTYRNLSDPNLTYLQLSQRGGI